MASRRDAQGSLSLTLSMRMLGRQRAAEASGTMPMPAPASTMRQTASNPVTRALTFIDLPSLAACPAIWRCSALSAGSPTKARSTTSARARARFRPRLSPRGSTTTRASSRNGNCSIVSGKAAAEAIPTSAAPDARAAAMSALSRSSMSRLMLGLAARNLARTFGRCSLSAAVLETSRTLPDSPRAKEPRSPRMRSTCCRMSRACSTRH